jgi:hypothetical protein
MKVAKCALVLSLACSVGACSKTYPSRGSGTIKTEARTVNGFTGVELSGSGKLIVEQGDTESLTITADDNLLKYLTSDVEKSKLTLATNVIFSLEPTAPITYRLTVKRLNTLGTSGTAIVEASGIRTDSLTIAVSGSADISISGEADAQKIAVSGTADYKADNFKTKDTSISISGSGKAVIAASNQLDVQIAGTGEVKYIGKPQITQSISGAGSVKAWTP